MQARCPKCGRKLRFSEQAVGRCGRCDACRQLLAVMRNGRLLCLEESHSFKARKPQYPPPLRPPEPKAGAAARDRPKLPEWYRRWPERIGPGGLGVILLIAAALWLAW